jgi:hypothetical protein
MLRRADRYILWAFRKRAMLSYAVTSSTKRVSLNFLTLRLWQLRFLEVLANIYQSARRKLPEVFSLKSDSNSTMWQCSYRYRLEVLLRQISEE